MRAGLGLATETKRRLQQQLTPPDMSSVDIQLRRVSKLFHENEDLTGCIIFDSKSESRHEGITLSVEGTVNMQLSSKSVGLFEAFYNSAKPISLISYTVEVAKSGKIPVGRTEVPFVLPLTPKGRKQLFPTYHGVFISIQYTIKCEVKRSMLSRDLMKVLEFLVEAAPSPDSSFVPKPMDFCVAPDSLRNLRPKDQVPRFKVTGRLDSSICRINDPFSGEMLIESCDAKIRSVELQLVRVETCGCAEGFAREVTEVQNIQISDGDVCRGLTFPIYMVFPRLFTCPTLITSNFRIEFEVNIVVIFEDNHLVTENIPIKIVPQ